MTTQTPDQMCTPCFRRHLAATLLGGTITPCTHGAPPPVSVAAGRDRRWQR